MKLHELSPAPGSTKERKRIGRGAGSGQGKTAGKGHKGQKARAGRGMRPGFEGGQMPLQRRLPKRGFNNIFRKEIVALNVKDLEKKFDNGAVVDTEALRAAGLVKNSFDFEFASTELLMRLNAEDFAVTESLIQSSLSNDFITNEDFSVSYMEDDDCFKLILDEKEVGQCFISVIGHNINRTPNYCISDVYINDAYDRANKLISAENKDNSNTFIVLKFDRFNDSTEWYSEDELDDAIDDETSGLANKLDDARVSIEDLIKKLKDKDNNMSKEELLETLEEIEDALYY